MPKRILSPEQKDAARERARRSKAMRKAKDPGFNKKQAALAHVCIQY